MRTISCQSRGRAGFTLIELILALAIMTMIVGSVGILASAVQDGSEYSNGYSTAALYGRVVSQRIRDTVSQSHASNGFPSCLVVGETEGGWRFPDSLVVWSPEGAAANPDGSPLVSELVIFTTNPANPHELWELTSRSNMNATPATSDEFAWQSLLASLKGDSASDVVILADQLRTATVTGATTPGFATLRPCLRFERRVLPSEAEWNGFLANTIAWDNLAWAQTIHGASTGMRQVWVRYEMQLIPAVEAGAEAPDDLPPIPFFGSATRTYLLNRP